MSQVTGSSIQDPDRVFQIPGRRSQIPDVISHVSDLRSQVSSFRSQVPSPLSQISGLQVLVFRFRVPGLWSHVRSKFSLKSQVRKEKNFLSLSR